MLTLPASAVGTRTITKGGQVTESTRIDTVLLSSIGVTSSLGPDNKTVRISAQRGEVVNGAFVPHGDGESYVINPDGSTLSSDGATGQGDNSFVQTFITACEQHLIASRVEDGATISQNAQQAKLP